MKTNDIKKGQRVLLRCGWQGTMADNGKGDTRIVNVEGDYPETGSVYSHDLVQAKSAAGEWVLVEHTPEQDTLRQLVGGVVVEGGPDMYGIPTESSEDCIGVFHSSGIDDLTRLDEGFYVGAFISPVVGCIVGPFATEQEAVKSMMNREWMGEQSSRLEFVSGGYRVKQEA